MSSIRIRTRTTRNGEKRFLVYFRRGGASYPEEYGGSFKTKRLAQVRCDAIQLELAAGRDPQAMLRNLNRPPERAPRLERVWASFQDSRSDVGVKAQAQYRNAAAWWLKLLGRTCDPRSITPQDVIDGVAEMHAKGLSPGTIGQYLSVLRQVLDYADVLPNPVKSPKVRLPKDTIAEVNPPTSREWFAIRDEIPARSLLALRLIEADGLRISEAVNLLYGDIDFIEGKVRVARAHTKTAAGRRWLPVPDELLDEVAALCPIVSREANLRVFPGLRHDVVRRDLQTACAKAEVTAHHPHELRHRRISLWLRLGFDPVQVSRWAGHARTSMSLDTYGHVVLDPGEDEWAGWWLSVYKHQRVDDRHA